MSRLSQSGLLLPSVALVVLTVVLPGWTRAGEENTDFLLANRAMQKLRADPQMLELHVMVQERVATLRGFAASAEVIRKAIKAVRTIPEIRDVRNQCSIGQPLAAPLTVVEPKPKKAEPPPPLVQSNKQTESNVPWNPDFLKIGPAPFKELPPRKETVTVAELPPLRIGVPMPTPTVIKAISRPKPVVSEPTPLEQTVRHLTQQDGRYHRLQLDIRDGAIIISGVALCWEDVHALSRTLRRLPGVERVVWRNIRTEGHR